MIKLSPRLNGIASLVLPPVAEHMPLAVCDVGTDHRYIPIYLLQKGVKFAVATDLSHGSADKAQDNVAKYGFNIDVRVGYGLETVNDNEVDTVIIAGMGGVLITEILQKGIPKGIKRFVMQPMRAVYELRKWLYENGFVIKQETLVQENEKIYNIIAAEPGVENERTYCELYMGANLVENRHPLLPLLAEREYRMLDKKLKGMAMSNLTDPKLEALKNYIKTILD